MAYFFFNPMALIWSQESKTWRDWGLVVEDHNSSYFGWNFRISLHDILYVKFFKLPNLQAAH